jgi:hypothetical protein
MKQAISKSGVYAIATETINQKQPEVVQLMQYYGMNVSQGDNREKIDKAFFSLLPRSRGFRKDFSTLATNVAMDMPAEYLNMSSTEYMNVDADKEKQKAEREAARQQARLKKISSDPKEFGETKIGQILSNESVQSILNTGLSYFAYKKMGGTTSSDNILNSATVGGGTDTTSTTGGGTGSNTGSGGKGKADSGIAPTTTILLVLGGLALVGGVGYLIVRNK